MPMNCLTPDGRPFALLVAAADGIGELDLASEEWVAEAAEVLQRLVAEHAAGLEGAAFTLCEVCHNTPVYLHAGSKLAWHAKFVGATVTVGMGELDGADCDLKIEGDHGVMSNAARIQYAGRDPAIVAQAQAVISKVGNFKFSGALPDSQALGTVLRGLHDAMAPRVLPKFPWMSPPWVANARQIAYERAQLPEFSAGLADEEFIFAEEFRNPPKYLAPDGVNGGFFVVVKGGVPIVGHGPLPEEVYGQADAKTYGE